MIPTCAGVVGINSPTTFPGNPLDCAEVLICFAVTKGVAVDNLKVLLVPTPTKLSPKLPNKKSFVVSGIGININYRYEDFPPELRDIATSLSIVTGIKYSREKIIAGILNILEKNYFTAVESGSDYIFTEWMKCCTTIGRRIRVVQSEKYYEGTVESIKQDGRLLIKNSQNDIIEITPSDIIKVIEYI